MNLSIPRMRSLRHPIIPQTAPSDDQPHDLKAVTMLRKVSYHDQMYQSPVLPCPDALSDRQAMDTDLSIRHAMCAIGKG